MSGLTEVSNPQGPLMHRCDGLVIRGGAWQRQSQAKPLLVPRDYKSTFGEIDEVTWDTSLAEMVDTKSLPSAMISLASCFA